MARDTSIKTYKEILEEGLLADMAERIFKLIHIYPYNSDREIAEISRLKINQVTARRNELVAQGCIEDAGIKVDQVTGRSVHIWVVSNPINFIKKPKSKNLQKKLTRFIWVD